MSVQLGDTPITVLVVEDNVGDVDLIIEQLQNLPAELFDCERVDRLEAALSRLSRTGVDVVLLDLGLPDSSGLETFHRMRQGAPDQPILVISGTDDVGIAVAAVQAGAQDYLVKGSMGGALLTRAIRYAIARKRADAALAASETHYRTILEHVADAVFVKDASGRLLDVNPAACELTGYSRDESLARSILDTCLPEDREAIGLSLHSARQEKLQPFERQLVRKDGSVILVEGTPILLPDGRILTTMRDVTGRRRQQDQLRESERRFRELAESVQEAFYILEPGSGLAQYVNPAYEQIFGHSLAHAAANGFAWTGQIHPEDREAVLNVEREGLRSGTYSQVVCRIQRESGQRWIQARTTPVRDARGTIVRLVGIAEDITELRRTEEQFFEAQKMEAVGRLAGGVAHDFNNILTAILGYVEILDSGMNPDDGRREDVAEIRLAAQRAAGLTRQLLAFSRHQVLTLAVLRPNEVIANLDRMLHRLIGEDIKLTLVLSEDAGNIRGDATQVEQVIMNLVVNARDAMPAGGTLLIATRNIEVIAPFPESHQPVPPGRYLLITVTDTGEGMTEQMMSRIFEPFFTTKEKGRGTGLGLSTVYGIVRQSDGVIGVSSEPGTGTTFRVYLPRVDVAVEPEPLGSVQPTTLAGTETILLAEDDPQLRRLCASLLARMGYRVLEAATADDALMIAQDQEQHIDLVLTDVVMPGNSGPGMVRQLHESRPGLPALFMSGYTGDAMSRLGMLRPGLTFLQKPFAPMELARRVRLVLDAPPESSGI